MTVFEPVKFKGNAHDCYKLHTPWHEKASLEISLYKRKYDLFSDC